MQGVIAIVRVLTFLVTAVLIIFFKGINLKNFFEGFGINDYVVAVMSYSIGNAPAELEMSLNATSSVQIFVLIIHIVTSFFAYESGKNTKLVNYFTRNLILDTRY